MRLDDQNGEVDDDDESEDDEEDESEDDNEEHYWFGWVRMREMSTCTTVGRNKQPNKTG